MALFREEDGSFLGRKMALFSGGIKGHKVHLKGPRGHRVALLKRHKGFPRGHLRCELWVLITDSSL